jgi:adenosylhomocysteine nucleosidase
MNGPIGIIIATKMEAKPFIEGLLLDLVEENPAPIYSGGSVILAVSGIGKTCAAIAAAKLIDRYHLRRLLNLGAAGSTSGKYRVGDILHIDAIYEPDRPLPDSGGPAEHRADTMEGFTIASLATQDRPALSDEERAAAGRYADLVDMEGAAVVKACRDMDASAYLFKIVTDTPGCSVRGIIRNILDTRDSLFEFCRDRVMPLL